MATLDWFVVAGYFLLLAATGLWLNRRQKTADDYFLASRRMPAWAVAISILATTQSAATFVGVPDAAFRGNLTYLSSSIGGIVAAFILVFIFIPAYYRQRATTPYQLLESRFGPTARYATSWAYLIGRIFATGARQYIGAIPAAYILFGPDFTTIELVNTIVILTAVSMAYTWFGGVSATIYTDVVQAAVYLLAALAAVVYLLYRIPGDLGDIFRALASAPCGSKLTVVDPGFDPSGPLGLDFGSPFTLLTAFLCFSLLSLASHGMDHDLVQRILTCPSPRRASRSLISGVLVGIPAVVLFLTIGLLLFVFYKCPDLMASRGPVIPLDESSVVKETFAQFMLNEMPAGLAGLMVIGLFAAGPAGVNGSLAAMSSAFVNDTYRRLKPNASDRHYLWAGRIAFLGWGVLVGAFGVLCIFWRQATKVDLLGLALSTMTFMYAGLLAVFLTALFTRRGNSVSVIAAIVTGFLVVLALQPPVFKSLTGADQPLAWPWHLPLGAAAAMLVCMAGPPIARRKP